jgi:4-hydroxybenzoate polyprenyltransferase
LRVLAQNQIAGLSRLKPFLALSRTPHVLLDIATPAFAALLWLGDFPSLKVVLIGTVTAFAGYTAVYALNDLTDLRVDKEKIQQADLGEPGDYLDAPSIRHPVAQGALSFKNGLLWALAWAALAGIGATLLNPVCVLIFALACALEILYCLLLRVTHLRSIVSGVVKSSGAIAAVFAVEPSPSLPFLMLLFLWLFFWEIGGQNVPNDWTEMKVDSRIGAKTLPVRFGPEGTSILIIASLLMTLLMGVLLFRLASDHLELPFVIASSLVGIFLLIVPAYRLRKTKEPRHALVLFNRASFYPLALLVLITIRILF